MDSVCHSLLQVLTKFKDLELRRCNNNISWQCTEPICRKYYQSYQETAYLPSLHLCVSAFYTMQIWCGSKVTVLARLLRFIIGVINQNVKTIWTGVSAAVKVSDFTHRQLDVVRYRTGHCSWPLTSVCVQIIQSII